RLSGGTAQSAASLAPRNSAASPSSRLLAFWTVALRNTRSDLIKHALRNLLKRTLEATAEVRAIRGLRLYFLLALLPCACGPASLARHESRQTARRSLESIDGTRWSWVEAECIDRPLDLFDRGFEQELRVETRNQGLLLTFDNSFMSEGCEQTIIMAATPALEAGRWQIVEEARVALPLDEACFGRPEKVRPGIVRLSGELLELIIYASDWCRGFDVRFAYRSVPNAPLTDHQVMRHYAAHFIRRDPRSIARLFAQTGSLIELSAPPADAEPPRHEGRQAVEAFFQRIFASTRWLAFRLIALEKVKAPGNYMATWDYMDAGLEKPFSGRNLFILAEGEIYQTEVQITTEIVESMSEKDENLLSSPKSAGR
ncbi:MAG: hypothetical protein JXA30_09895, partial [Deltaproteobacteria bacterium]|nr:hypothetical protein [Deltaproteobacteria bacterium]